MKPTPPTFKEWLSPSPSDLGTDYISFLKGLNGPTWISVPGLDHSRRRAIVTLLHGNEPSGLKAVHHLLKKGIKPATDLGIFIASVNAARQEPMLSHRFLPGEEDLNRCFAPPFNTDQRKLAQAMLEKLIEFAPEAVIDTHNTSAHSEPFAVATTDNLKTLQLTELFTRQLVVLDLRLGTLIEQWEKIAPVVTIEFGGLMDPNADTLALESIKDFICRDQLFTAPVVPLMILRHPHRLEVNANARLHYSSSVADEADITIFNTIDQLNFSRVKKGSPLGWIDSSGMGHLRIKSADGDDLLQDYLGEDNGFLVTTRDIILFMATTDPYIAAKDCLLYLTPAE